MKSVKESSPRKPSTKRPLSSPQPRNGGDDGDIDDITHILGQSPMLNNDGIDSDDSNNGDGLDLNELCNKVDELFGGWVNKKVIKRMKSLIKDEDCKWNGNGDSIRLATKQYLFGLLLCDDNVSSIGKMFKKRQKTLGKKINKLRKSKGGGFWQSNFGEALSDLTEGAVLANYAPLGDSSLQNENYQPASNTAEKDKSFCRIPRTNSCMAKFIKVSVIVEFFI